jgi:hypothetical protein
MERIIYSLDPKSINDLCDDTLICNSIFSGLCEKEPYEDNVEVSEKTRTYHVYGYSSDTVVKFADLLISKISEVKIEGYYKAIGGESRSSHAGRTTSYSRGFFLYQLPDQIHRVYYGHRFRSAHLLRYSANPKAYLRNVNFAVKAENIIPGIYFTTISRSNNDVVKYGKIFYVPMEGCDKNVLDSTLNFLKNKEGGENDIKLLEALEKRVNEILYEN